MLHESETVWDNCQECALLRSFKFKKQLAHKLFSPKGANLEVIQLTKFELLASKIAHHWKGSYTIYIKYIYILNTY